MPTPNPDGESILDQNLYEIVAMTDEVREVLSRGACPRETDSDYIDSLLTNICVAVNQIRDSDAARRRAVGERIADLIEQATGTRPPEGPLQAWAESKGLT